ncbi:dienelactone hydrolase family protein [Anaerolineae bacterium CFX8]|nr:dienelactone hydrolase family protein [Anaerolineae bacterium CFX8]
MVSLRFIVIGLIVLAGLALPFAAAAQETAAVAVSSGDVEVMSGGQAYVSYLAAPADGGPYPAVVLIHSFNGLEEGYRTMTDLLATEGFVVLAVGWQTFERSPSDAVVRQLLDDSAAFLSARPDVDAARIGLTGFCAGGRYTMLLLPQMDVFAAGVAWYGFPYSGDTQAANLAADLDAPMLMIHGTNDQPSPIGDIYRYAGALADAGAYFELKVYQGEPHGFMLSNGQLREDEIARDAFDEMVRFFRRKL